MQHKRDDRGRNNFTRVNFQIRVPNVRVVKDDEQLGVMTTDKARRLAMDAGLDLVEVAPDAKPYPVCHILEYSKYKYEQKQKEKQQRKHQRESQQEIKEIRLTPAIQMHDIETKAGTVRRFLAEGKKVQLTLQYRRRENAHKDEGFKVVNAVLDLLKEDCEVELKPKLEGNRLTCRVQPKTVDSTNKKVVLKREVNQTA